ncbi:TonB-dependent receptor [Ferruginibacter sp. SUN106]|uniref:TonB-dependent receptor n=1 Tax=Ferruginibacter sp. SUN106 TaxID=2978348 RepID=UPI003D369113
MILIFVFFTAIVAPAQTMLKGKVVDAQSRQPLEAASVSVISNDNDKALTDEYGNFLLKTKSQHTNIAVSHIGYKTYTATTTGNLLIIELQPDAIKLEDVKLQATGTSKFSSLAKIDLALSPVKNTQELLRLVPGLFIAQHAGGGKAEQIFLRGFDCDHGTDVQVSVDGMPVNMVSHAHGQGYADSHFIIPETINNIDFGAGPYYTQHGNLNTAGYVAFSTFKNIPKSLVQIEGGNFNSFRTLAMIDLLKKNKDKQSAYIAGEFNYTDGPTQNKQNFNRINVFTKYNAAITANTNLSFSASAFKSKWDASGQVPERAIESGLIDRFGSIDPSEGGNTERYNANLTVTHQFKNGATLDNQVFLNRYAFNLYSNFSFFLNDPVNGDEINQAETRNIFGYSSKIKQKYFFGKWTLTSTDGIGVRHDATDESKLAHVVKRQFLNYIKLGDIKETNVYAFTQQQATVGNWVIDAGVRFDYFHFNYYDRLNVQQMPSQAKSIVSPKLNIQYNISKTVHVYVKAGKGFHSNDTRVVIANDGKQILPAAYGTDFGVILKPAKDLLLNIAAWNLYLDQEFVYVGDDGNVEPSGRTKRQGLDIIARYQFTKYLFANANINFTKPRARDEAKGQDYIPLAPTATSTGGLFYKKQTGFNGGIKYRYIKSRPANEDNSVVAKGYFLLDASINYTQPKYEIGLSVENLFNIKWNEAQFATESRLQNEPNAITELNFTPGTPLFAKVKLAVFF